MHLYEQGMVGLNDTVFGPNGILNDSIYLDIIDPLVYGIKVKHLLSHQSVMYASGFNLMSSMLNFAPGSSATYSNSGYVWLGRVIEKITTQDYETYVRDTILAPIGITDMHSGKSLLIDQFPNEVHYYDYPGAPLVPSLLDPTILVPRQYGGTFSMEVSKACGGWIASAQDLCKLLCAVDKFSSRPDILSQATISTMVQPVHSFLGNPYALGWYINTTSYNWYHSGGFTGTMTYQARRNTEINYALCVNSNYSSGQYTALSNLVSSIIPLITSWPTFDLFDSTVVCSPLSSVNNIPQNQSLFTVYPNPAKSQITVKVDALLLGSNYIIYDFTGKSVLSGKIISEDSLIELGNLSGGIYLLSVGENMNQTFKVIKE
jgi:hypothetical protein